MPAPLLSGIVGCEYRVMRTKKKRKVAKVCEYMRKEGTVAGLNAFKVIGKLLK